MARVYAAIAVLGSVAVSLFLIEAGIRFVYYQQRGPYDLGLYHMYRHKLAPLFQNVSNPSGLDLNKQAWEASYTERGLSVPEDGPREGYWGKRIRPKNYENCGLLRYCEAERTLPGLIEFDAQGMQRAGQGELHVLIVGGSVAAGAYASSIESTYFAVLSKLVPFRVSVLAAGGWVSDDEVAAFAERGVSLEPDVVVFLNGLNDLILDEPQVRYLNVDGRIKFYLRNMWTAGVLAKANGIEVIYALQPSLRDKVYKTELEQAIMKTSFSGSVDPCFVSLDAHPSLDSMRNGLKDMAKKLQLRFVDLSGVLNEERQTTFADAFHFSDHGHQLLAQELAGSLSPR